MTEDQDQRRSAAEEALAARVERLAQRRRPAATADARPLPASPAAKRTRRHPARAARYAAVGMSVLSTAGLTSLFMSDAGGSPQTSGGAVVVSTGGGAGQATNPTGGSTATSRSTSGNSAAAGGSPTVVDGAVYRNRWGDVQVEASFAADGSLVSVDAIQSPDGQGRSIEINDYAVPQLDAEAIDLQSAQVDTVSGATYTSESYRSSLQSAIDAARAASATTLD